MIFEYFVFSTVYIQNVFSGVHPQGPQELDVHYHEPDSPYSSYYHEHGIWHTVWLDLTIDLHYIVNITEINGFDRTLFSLPCLTLIFLRSMPCLSNTKLLLYIGPPSYYFHCPGPHNLLKRPYVCPLYDACSWVSWLDPVCNILHNNYLIA